MMNCLENLLGVILQNLKTKAKEMHKFLYTKNHKKIYKLYQAAIFQQNLV